LSNLFVGTSAAQRLSFLLLKFHLVHDFHERRHSGLRGGLQQVSTVDGLLQIGLVSARAALSLTTTTTLLGLACRAFANKLALGFGASDRLLALPVAFSGLAHRSAHSIRSLALSTAVSRRADSLAFGAILLLAQIFGATNIALRLVTVDLAGSAGSLLAVNLALRTLADGVALSRAYRVIALPSALRMAVSRGLSADNSEQSHEG